MMHRSLAVLLAAAFISGACSSGAGRSARGDDATSAPTASQPSVPSPRSTTMSTHGAPAVLSQRYEPTLPIAIQEAAAASTGDRLYVVGGYDTSENSSAAVFELAGMTWHRAPSLPIAVNHPGAAVIGDSVYVAGGFTANGATNRAFVLARGSTTWRELAPMQRARGALALVALGGRLYAIGGHAGSVQIAVPEVYDPNSGGWSDLPSMPEPRNHVAGYVDGAVCVAGGRTPGSSGAVDCLDPSAPTWQRRATLPTPTSGAAAAAFHGVTVVAGGETAGETSIVGVVQWSQRGAWRTTPMLLPRHGTAFAVLHGRLWLCGGATRAGFHAVGQCTSIAAGP